MGISQEMKTLFRSDAWINWAYAWMDMKSSSSGDSPTYNDTLLVPDHKQPGKKKMVSKLLSYISICELHNDLISESSIYKLK